MPAEFEGQHGMAGVRMESFDWGGLDALLSLPPGELAARVSRRRSRGEFPFLAESFLPPTDPDLVRFIGSLLANEDWYAGRPTGEANAVDEVVLSFFADAKLSKPLKLRPLSDGVSFDALQIAQGWLQVDESRVTPRSRHLHVRRSSTPPPDLPELLALGCRPFRHPAWDRLSREARSGRCSPFHPGIRSRYQSQYSIHSPEQVDRLMRELSSVADGVRDGLGRLSSKRVRENAIADFEQNLFTPIRTCAAERRAVAAWVDT